MLQHKVEASWGQLTAGLVWVIAVGLMAAGQVTDVGLSAWGLFVGIVAATVSIRAVVLDARSQVENTVHARADHDIGVRRVK